MAEFSSTLRYTGLSGIDTEGMVRSLMNAESIRYNTMKAAATKIQWKQDAYRGVATALKSFQTSFLDILATNTLSSKSTFNLTSSSVKLSGGSASSAATVKTTGTSSVGKHKLEVIKLASKDVYAGEKVGNGTVTGTGSINDLLNMFSDSSNAVEEVRDPETGDVVTEAKKLSEFENGTGFRLNIDGVVKNITIDKTEIAGITDEESLINLLNSKIEKAFGANKASFDAVPREGGGNSLQLSASSGHNAVLLVSTTSEQFNLLSAAGINSSSQTNLNLEGSISDVLGIKSSGTVMINGEAVKGGVLTINGKEIKYADTDKVSDLMKNINHADTGVKLSFDSFTQKFKLESTSVGEVNKIDSDLFSSDIFTSMGLSQNGRSESDWHTSVASDAEFEFDGVRSSRSTNSFLISGLNITLNAATPNETLEIDVVKDTTSSVDAIKKFVDAYNTLIGNMNTSTSQARAKKSQYDYYEPLTDEQRDAMTESQIEKWESKAQEGILKNDDILNGITSSMRSWLYESVTMENGKKISLYEIGITTSTKYQEKGKLVIDEEKLLKALEEKPDEIAELFAKQSDYSYSDKKNANERMKQQGLAGRLNDIVNNAISGTGSISKRAGIKGEMSEYTSDLYLKLKDHNEKVADMLKYLTRKETSYYEMFSKMESAMTKANSQASYLASQLGM